MLSCCRTCRLFTKIESCALHGAYSCYCYKPLLKVKVLRLLVKLNPRKTFTFQGSVQYCKGEPSIVGSTIEWFDPVSFRGWFWQEHKYEKATLAHYKKLYPEVAEFISLF